MAALQKNIWTIFYVLFIRALCFLGYVSYAKWENVHKKYTDDQTHQVKLVSNAMHALLLSQETSLNILGHQLLKEQNAELLDALLALNPSVVAYGFADVEGNYLHVNSHFDKTKLPNLRQNPLTQDSFDYTLTQDKMVLGRTYFIPGGGRWGIPIRKTIFNGGGKPLGVMTAGLSIEGAFKLFAEELSLGEHNTVMFVRERDGYVQYYSSLQEISKEVYDAPLPQEFLDGIVVQIGQNDGVSYEQMKESNRIFLQMCLVRKVWWSKLPLSMSRAMSFGWCRGLTMLVSRGIFLRVLLCIFLSFLLHRAFYFCFLRLLRLLKGSGAMTSFFKQPTMS